MKYEIEKLEKSQVKFSFTLTAEEWEKAIENAYQKNKHKYAYAGYRKGKVPRKLLEGVYGKAIFLEDAFNDSFPNYYGEALDKETWVFPVSSPDVDITKVDDEGIQFFAITTVKPEVALGEYKGIKISKKEYNVEDKDIEEVIKAEQEKISRMVEISDRACQNDDTVNIDYSGSVDGVKFDGGTAEKQDLVLGSNTFIPGFEEQVVGMNIGEEKDITVKFPEEYFSKDLAGKDAVFSVKLNSISKKELPEIDDEFAKDVSEFENLNDYKADIQKKLAEQNEQKSIREYEDELVEKIVANASVEIPAVMIENQIDDMIKETEYRMMYQGMKLEDYLKYANIEMKDFRENHRQTAEMQVKTQLVVDKIIKDEKIEADEESVNAKIAELAEQAKKTVEEYKKGMPERQLSYIQNQVISDKLFAFLKEQNPLV